MCGLAGALTFDPGRFSVTEDLLLAMRETMVHRGPDGADTWLSDDRTIGLAHRRLAIIDLSPKASQPMATADGALYIVFNGEIYNHTELRDELTALGCRDWRTDHSDTEVVLNAFRQWGIDCLHRFRGMFAIALWDAREKALWLIRDRIGIKPLYYALDGRGIAFASEIKAILADRSRTRAVDEEAFFHFLSFMATPAPQTLFAGIRKLAAGTWLRVSADGAAKERRWWCVLENSRDLPASDDAGYAEMLLEELRTAVRYRKVADVPVGVFLSGGIDSSTNVALFSEHAPGPVKTFAIGYDGQSAVADELPYARMMAREVGAEHHEIRLTQDDLLDFLPKMVWLQDEPIADPVCVPVYYVSKLARENGVTVCQVGEGADELFCGYPGWKMLLFLGRLNRLPVPRFLKRAGIGALNAVGAGERTPTELLRRAVAGQPLFWGGAQAFTETHKRRLLSHRLRKEFADVSSWDALAPLRRRFETSAADRSDLNWMTFLDLNLRLPELLLMRVDKMSMGVSLEARVPFLDHEVVSLAMSVPTEVKMRNGELKYLLKRAVAGLIPDQILRRPKQGFSVPVSEWLLGRLGEEARVELRNFCDQTDLLDRDVVDRMATRHPGQQVWYLLNFALWWRQFIAS